MFALPLPASLILRPGLSIGDVWPNWFFTDPTGREFSFYTDSVAGHCTVILHVPSLSEESRAWLVAWSSQAADLTGLGARLYAIVGRGDVKSLPPLPFPVLEDRDDQVSRARGENEPMPATLLLRHNNHLAGLFRGPIAEQVAEAVARAKRICDHGGTRAVELHHPPVLLIPEVFSAQECRDLIRVYQTRGQVFLREKQAIDHIGADYKMRVPEHMREDRVDHFFFDADTVAFLKNRLNRVLPEIHKAFQYRVTRYESLRMACYRGSRGGLGHGHRDNIPPHLHRRFAMSINLNVEEFEGGELRFPEFGDRRYRPGSGTAIVFSSSLVHEALEVTRGTRYVFLLFLFGEH